jgi:hypothetical protein
MRHSVSMLLCVTNGRGLGVCVCTILSQQDTHQQSEKINVRLHSMEDHLGISLIY